MICADEIGPGLPGWERLRLGGLLLDATSRAVPDSGLCDARGPRTVFEPTTPSRLWRPSFLTGDDRAPWGAGLRSRHWLSLSATGLSGYPRSALDTR